LVEAWSPIEEEEEEEEGGRGVLVLGLISLMLEMKMEMEAYYAEPIPLILCFLSKFILQIQLILGTYLTSIG
jgi:hypothetical protein